MGDGKFHICFCGDLFLLPVRFIFGKIPGEKKCDVPSVPWVPSVFDHNGSSLLHGMYFVPHDFWGPKKKKKQQLYGDCSWFFPSFSQQNCCFFQVMDPSTGWWGPRLGIQRSTPGPIIPGQSAGGSIGPQSFGKVQGDLTIKQIPSGND